MLRVAVSINYYDDAIVLLFTLSTFLHCDSSTSKQQNEMVRNENVFHLTNFAFLS